jgi:hypothetical protein
MWRAAHPIGYQNSRFGLTPRKTASRRGAGVTWLLPMPWTTSGACRCRSSPSTSSSRSSWTSCTSSPSATTTERWSSCSCASSCASTNARSSNHTRRAGRRSPWPALPPGRPLAGLLGLHAGHPAALASRDHQAEVDLRQPPQGRPPAGLGGVRRAHRAPGSGESPLGLRQASGRARQARPPGLPLRDQADPPVPAEQSIRPSAASAMPRHPPGSASTPELSGAGDTGWMDCSASGAGRLARLWSWPPLLTAGV